MIKSLMRVAFEVAGWYFRCVSYSKQQAHKVRRMNALTKANSAGTSTEEKQRKR